jgi:ribonuclease Z
MKITLLGTGSPVPDPNRAGPATLVVGGEPATTVLVDAGRGVVTRLAAAGTLPVLLHGVLLTHLHSDHVSDLNDVITTQWVMAPDQTPLQIVGPRGTAAFVARTLEAMQDDISYRVNHHADMTTGPTVTVREVEPGEEFSIGGLTIKVGATDHRPVAPTVAYRIFEGERSVVLAGDGIPCASLDELLVGAQAYVQTVIREDLVKLVPMPRFQDILDYHSTVTQAALTATRTGVGTLILTHYVPAPPVGGELEWASEATTYFSGTLVAGPDLTSVEI